MMKIEKILINGIRGFNYITDDAGEPCPHLIELNRKHLFLYGENGAGKSSLFDAIEWCLTGEFKESSSRKIQGKSDKRNFLINQYCDTSVDDPSVEISLIEQKDTYIKIRRSINDSRESFKYANEGEICLIESNRIEQFVIDTKQSLWNTFSNLLGFDDLIQFERQLFKLKNESHKQHDIINDNLNVLNKAYKDKNEDISGLEATFYKEFGDNWAIKIGEESNNDEIGRYTQLVKLNEQLSNILEIYSHLKQQLKDKIIKEKLLINEESDTTVSKMSDIVEAACDYFSKYNDIDICPLCGQPIEYYEVFDKLKDLKSNLRSRQTIKKEMSIISKEIDEDYKRLSALRSEIILSYNGLFVEVLDDEIKPEDLIAFAEDKRPIIKKEIELLSKKMQINNEVQKYRIRKEDIAKLETSIKDKRSELKRSERIAKEIDRFYEMFFLKYSEKIREELDIISKNEVTSIYRSINQSDNELVDEFIIEPDIEKKEITFKAKIKDKEQMIDAKVLSTGHLRCLGFALLIARINAKVENLKFIIIDDPIYSIDHEHRYNLIRYLVELGRTYQLIITSSDRVFIDILRHQFNTNSFESYEMYTSKMLGVINIKRSKKQYIDEATAHLERRDFRAAALYTRLSLETTLFSIAEKLKIKINVQIIRREKISIGDLLNHSDLKKN